MAFWYRRWKRVAASLLLSVTVMSPMIVVVSLPALAETQLGRKAEAERLLEAGIQAYKAGKTTEALETFQKALLIFRQIGDRRNEWRSLGWMGVVYSRIGQPQKALELQQQSLVITQQIGDRSGEGNTLNNIGLIYDSLGQYQQALEVYQYALAILKQIHDRFGEGTTLNNIGLIYDSLGQYPKALEFYQQALAIYVEKGVHEAFPQESRSGEGTTLNNIGVIYYYLGQYPQALEFCQQALVIRKEISDRFGESTTLNTIGAIYDNLGKYPKALEFYQQALAIRKEIGDRSGEGNSFNNIGSIYDSLGQYPKALEFYQRALAIRKEIGDRSGEGSTLDNIGLIYGNLGQYLKALEFYQQALAIRKQIGDRKGEGTTLNNIGQIYDNLGQYPKALEFYQQALAILKQISNFQGEGTILNNIGSIYDGLGQYPKALEFYQRALAILKQIGDRKGEGSTLNNIGLIYSRLGQYSKALEFYQQALVILKEISDRKGEGNTLNNIGLIYSCLRQYPKALDLSQQALVTLEEIGDRKGEGTTLNNIGLIYDSLGQYPKALGFYQQALTTLKQIGDRSSEGSSLNNIGGIYGRLGQYAKALEFYQQSLAISKRIGDRSVEGKSLNNIGGTLLRLFRTQEAEAVLFKAIEVLESLRPGLTDENKVSLFETQADTYRFQQVALVTQNKFETALEVSERGRARAFVELLATRINGTEKPTPQLNQNLRPTINQIKQIAQERNATMIEYSIINDKTLYIWVVQPSGTVTHRKVALPPQTSLTALVDTSREDIGVRGRGNFKIEINKSNPTDRLKQLHQLLIAPIADLLPADPNAQVIFIPHGELFLVPFVALQDANGKYLIEQHTILTAPAIQVLDFTRQNRQRGQQTNLREAVVVGNPTMPQLTKPGEAPEPLKALPNAEVEARAIAALLHTQAWTGNQATKAAIVPKLASARIIHLATHGFLDDLKSLGTPGAIALAPSGTGEPNDGFLTANEILDLKLNAELVVLSACDTGRGRITGDSVIGLSRSLILAGTPSVMVSLWSVPDASTAGLMTEFYRNWQERKLDKAQALRQAMLTMMQRPGATPRDWAAFTLIGESK